MNWTAQNGDGSICILGSVIYNEAIDSYVLKMQSPAFKNSIVTLKFNPYMTLQPQPSKLFRLLQSLFN